MTRWKWRGVTTSNETWHGYVNGVIAAEATFNGVDKRGKTSWTLHMGTTSWVLGSLAQCRAKARAVREAA